MNMKGNHIVVNDYLFLKFKRTCFDYFEVTADNSGFNFELLSKMRGNEVELSCISDCETFSRATVKLHSEPEIVDDKILAVFKVAHYEDKKTREMKPKGGYLEWASC